MPWKETSAMDQRLQLISDWLSNEYTKSELSRVYEVSRPTVDKWLKRYEERGPQGLEDFCRAPHSHPNETPEALRTMIIQTKLRHQTWGPKKVLDRLRQQQPTRAWPADSTGGEILKRAGLVRRRVTRRHVPPYSLPFSDCSGSNHTWSADFKGDFGMGNRQRCYPLTITDNFSRYLLLCRALEHPTYQAVRPWFEWVFRVYGLPDAIRSDNGAPFASLAVGGISQLSKWWIRLGIKPERIRPGKPAQNGRHERMHRTLKQDVPPQANVNQQQRCYDAYREEYNCQRSHEALHRKTPASVYQSSPRPYPAKLPEIEYGSAVTVRQVRHNGEIKWGGELIYVSEVLAKEAVGLTPIEDGVWDLRYSFHLLGILDVRTNKNKITSAQGWHGANLKKV
jgi:transposase InsO family protein